MGTGAFQPRAFQSGAFQTGTVSLSVDATIDAPIQTEAGDLLDAIASAAVAKRVAELRARRPRPVRVRTWSTVDAPVLIRVESSTPVDARVAPVRAEVPAPPPVPVRVSSALALDARIVNLWDLNRDLLLLEVDEDLHIAARAAA